MRTRFGLNKDGGVGSNLLSELPRTISETPSRIHTSVVNAWHQTRGEAILEMLRWLITTIQLSQVPVPSGNPAVAFTSIKLVKCLPNEERWNRSRYPESLLSLARSRETTDPEVIYGQWLTQTRKLLQLCRRSQMSQPRVFDDFQNLLETLHPTLSSQDQHNMS
eukprot:Protomagalhaensia_wolfi_Nauph_80__3537@NODE_3587_length_761_cov_54_022161_g2686_i1_p1_GENE_NODE_3587_length_761_cov_54_022161_g2686_i1NODE_3587_length_761_cov_54_022161_g2686_i1_p1_ORF_typecomplete_len164_score16_31RsbRD_N/PF14361_6/0_13_NODE_3587_length_761_cov_54_022161_g2686_i1173664